MEGLTVGGLGRWIWQGGVGSCQTKALEVLSLLAFLVQKYKYLRRRRPAGRPRPPSRHAQRTRRRGGPPLSATADRNAGSSSGDDGAGGHTDPAAAVQPPDWNAVWAAPESASTSTSNVGGQRAAYTTRGGAAPDWLTDPEARQAIADGSAWLERDATGWHLVRAGPDGTTPLVPGDDVDAVLQGLEDSRLLGDDEAWRYMQPPPATQRPGRRSRLRYKSTCFTSTNVQILTQVAALDAQAALVFNCCRARVEERAP